METLKAVSILLRASQSLETVLKNDIESYGINTTEFGVLELLFAKGKQPMQVIGQKLLMANSSITYVIDQLQKKEHVRRFTNPDDRRGTLIELTPSGHQFFESIFPKHKKTVNSVFSVLSQEELGVMNTALKKIGYHSQEILSQGK